MSSATIFVNKVVSVLQEIGQEKMVSFELFFTGHALGVWLAQITTLPLSTLRLKEAHFLRN